MTATTHLSSRAKENSKRKSEDNSGFLDIDSLIQSGTKRLKRLLHLHALFHVISSIIFAIELSIFIYYLVHIPKSIPVALSLSSLVLTFFVYLVFLFYFQTKKPEQFFDLRDWFIYESEKNVASSSESESLLFLANAAYRFSQSLEKLEYNCYRIPKSIESLSNLIRKLSFTWHGKDLIKMKELLFLFSIEQHIKLIKKEPTDLEVHASCANTHLSLSQLYEQSPYEEHAKRFEVSIGRAIEEFKILNTYVPNDPWVIAQLASCYHDLKEYQKEIDEYERILSICP